MLTGESVLARFVASVRDGTLPFKVLNRLARVQYVPSPQVAIDRYVARHYPGKGWRRLSPAARRVWVQYHPLFQSLAIRTIVYIGANVGATPLALDDAFPGLKFYLLEPVPSTFQELADRTRGRANMHCLNVAAGAAERRQTMYVDAFSPASSLLPHTPLALHEFPFLGARKTTDVCVRPLDAILGDLHAPPVDLLLMDVQGYEDEVLRGAARTLRSCAVVIAELSLQPMYVGSSTFDYAYQALVREGFSLRYLWNPLEGESQQILQVDGVFVRDAARP